MSNFSFDPLPKGMRCVRCKKLCENQSWVSFANFCPQGTLLAGGDGDCEPMMVLYGYHQKCLPPNIFHKFAGSLPADHAVPMLSLKTIQHSKGTVWNRIVRESRR